MTPEQDNGSLLEARNLTKHYQSGSRVIEVLRGISLEILPARTISIRGESGSGKSTFLNLLAGIETADSGEVLWQGKPLSRIPDSSRPSIRATYLGFVFQSFYLIPELNTLENVLLAARIAGLDLKEARTRASHLLEELGLQDRSQSRPEQLSGGERQRTAIARALMNQPRVLLADEPTGNLDEHTSERVMQQLLEIVRKHDTSLVLVTHHPGFAAQADQQYHLVDGHLRS